MGLEPAISDFPIVGPTRRDHRVVIITLRRFLHNHGNTAQKETRSRDYALLLSNNFKGSIQCTLPYTSLHTSGL